MSSIGLSKKPDAKNFEILPKSQRLEAFWKVVNTSIIKGEAKHLRKGQLYMNSLHDVDPDLYLDLSGTEFDCFYDDTKIEAFLAEIQSEWNE